MQDEEAEQFTALLQVFETVSNARVTPAVSSWDEYRSRIIRCLNHSFTVPGTIFPSDETSGMLRVSAFSFGNPDA